MITKKLIHDVITFCNNYIDNENIVISITIFKSYIYVNFQFWELKCGFIDNCISNIGEYIYNEKDFIKYKQEVLEKLPKLLEQLKQN